MIYLGDEVDERFLRELLLGGYLVPMPRQRAENNIIYFPCPSYGALPLSRDGKTLATAKIIPFPRWR